MERSGLEKRVGKFKRVLDELGDDGEISAPERRWVLEAVEGLINEELEQVDRVLGEWRANNDA